MRKWHFRKIASLQYYEIVISWGSNGVDIICNLGGEKYIFIWYMSVGFVIGITIHQFSIKSIKSIESINC